jgi:predicted YcjX-like family ATPase
VPIDGAAPEGSLWAMMVRRYEAYKDVVVRPFFRDHFSRLDRQIVLVDALSAFNADRKPWSISRRAGGILDCFRIGRSTFLSALFRPRIDRILLPRPRPIIFTIPAMTAWRPCCGGPWQEPSPAPRTPAP